MIEIKTGRLILKKPTTKKDQISLVSQIEDWEVVRWFSKIPYELAMNCKDYLKMSNKNELDLSIFLDDKLIGGVGLALNDDDNYYELGYWVGKDYWGKGYATESSKYLLEYALRKLDSPKIKTGYFIDNIPSGNVLKKLGFKEVGIEKKYSEPNKKEMSMMFVELEFSSIKEELL